ncbi:Hydrogenase transcriptional regulatory protein hupR1 [Paraburkholderia rhynchosiae]|uniref:Hydrogenase transcriptional regulatory protein hupR1 n=1 Tax=Paraburkholderia rhynchosiae TaxID=487049 RepID=A0A6J4ZN81_9BURK|nr:Hydrogenase transcriptional regulatory protein hupR1 [Paraburkholderia rhynchosiae]
MRDTQQARQTILYVDDEELARKYFARAAGSDYEVLLASGADEAMSILRRDARVAVLVTDFRMPGRHGDDLLRQVAQEYPHLVRILVTAYTDNNALLGAANFGEVFRILEKPLGVGTVREVLASATTAAVSRPR